MESRLKEALGEISATSSLFIGAFIMLVRVVHFFPTSVISAKEERFKIRLADYPIEIEFKHPHLGGKLWKCELMDKENEYEISIMCENIDLKDVRKIADLIIKKFHTNMRASL